MMDNQLLSIIPFLPLVAALILALFALMAVVVLLAHLVIRRLLRPLQSLGDGVGRFGRVNDEHRMVRFLEYQRHVGINQSCQLPGKHYHVFFGWLT